ncbi:MAG: hypothetical protein IPL23_26250 [Saprospiraceae bacterium]|nr:hypothetical protein [Saprospiraceae bacterium]
MEILGERNFFSKTGPLGFTFMRLKDDHMQNGQLKPAYNTQISTEGQFITLTSVFISHPADTTTLESHLTPLSNSMAFTEPSGCSGDAGYGG